MLAAAVVAVPFSFSACISFDAAGQTHLEAALSAYLFKYLVTSAIA
jgi:hypothetical protein